MPLQMLSGPEVNAELNWDGLWKWHEGWVTELFPTSGFLSSKLTSTFDTQATCILFDGLDEFLALHNEVSSSHMLSLMKGALKRYRTNDKFSIVTVCRSSLPGVENYADTNSNSYEVARLSIDDAKNNFPVCGAWLDFVKDQNLLDVVLTPLILSSLDDQLSIDNKPLNATHIIGQTIDAILRKSSLEGATLPDGTVISREHLLIALMLIAWAFFKHALGEVSLHRMRIEVQVVASQWAQYLEANNLKEENDSLSTSLALLSEEKLITGLVQRTLFITTGHSKVRFSNRQWHDYLIALYFKQCLLFGNVDDFGETAFNPTIFIGAGDLMSGDIITESMAERAVQRWKELGASSIVGDLLAFISLTTVPIEPAAVRYLLSEIGNYHAITRVVLLAGFGYRGLENAKNDPSAKDIRQALLPTIKTMADCENCPVGDRIASSISWCYLNAYAEKFGVEMIDLPWPDLRFNNDGQKIALQTMCKEADGKFQLDKFTKSLQLAFLKASRQAEKNPNFLIRSMHYLYFLVIAKKFGTHILELNEGLDKLLSDTSELSAVVDQEKTMPELKLLYKYLQTL